MKKKVRKFLYFVLLAVLLAVFGFSACQVINYVSESRKQAALYDDLASIVENAATKPTIPGFSAELQESGPSDGEAVSDGGILAEYEELYQMNADLAGWIKIEGTKINYPVMQTPELTDFYLYRNFQKEYSAFGSIYAREDCDLSTPSDNVTLYGHHMKDGSMFAGLDDYADKSFWEGHRYIQFDTLYEHRTYEIFAVFKTSATVGKGFEYHSFVEAGSAEDFDWFVKQCKSLSFYSTGITPEYGDKLLCLSTCEYTLENGRLVVVAVLLD